MSDQPLKEVLALLGFEIDKDGEKQIHNTIGRIKEAALALGEAFAVREIAEFVTSTVEGVAKVADDIGELALKVGVSAEAIQSLGAVAKDNGASMEDLATGLKFLSKNAVAAKDGSKEAGEAFAKAGLRFRDANGHVRNADDMMVDLADKMAALPNEAERTALAMKLLGRSGTQLIPTLLKGSAALREERDEARRLGGVMDDELLRLGDEFETSEHRQTMAVQGLRNAFAKELLPTFIRGKNAMTELIVRARPLAEVLGRGIARALELVHKAADPVVSVLEQAAGWMEKLMGKVGGASTAVDMLAVAILGVATLLAAQAVAMAVSWLIGFAPVLLMIVLVGVLAVAIGLVVEDLLAMGDGADSVSGTMIKGFTDLVEILGGIGPAVGEMLKTAIDYWVEFFTGAKDIGHGIIGDLVDWMTGVFGSFFGWIADQFKAAFKSVGQFASGDILGGLKTLGQNALETVKMMTPGVASTGFASPAAGGTTVNATANVDVNANVSGVQGASDVGVEIRKHVEAAMSDHYRQIHQSFATAAPSLPGAP